MDDMQAKTKPKVTITMYNDLPAGQLGAGQMWSGDVVNAQYYLPKGVKPDGAALLVPAGRQGHGRQRPDGAARRRARTRCWPTMFINFMLDAEERARQLRLHRLPAAAEDARRRTKIVSDGYVPGQPRARRWSSRSGSTTGYRLLELPPDADAAWHEIWQEFKAGA